jgi:hypothetical protein
VTDYAVCHDTSEWVQLNPLEFRSAAVVGVWIWEKSHANGRADRDAWQGFNGDRGKRIQALGSLCERIAAKCLGIYWPSAVDNFTEPDLDHNIEVRLIGCEHYGLRVYPRTDDTRRVIGVVMPEGTERGNPPGSFRYRVAGWCQAGDAKRDEWQMAPHGRPPMWCVPQSELLAPQSLRDIIVREMIV